MASIDPVTRMLFPATAAAGCGLFWITPYPPMTDLPQHAGQVALWGDVLRGVSPWQGLFDVNLLTPYLAGYGLALPLSHVLPIAAALKLLLTLAYLAFIVMCVRLRRQFGGDPALDWLFPMGWFGLAYQWGFMTFLVAAPIGLAFVAVAARHAEGRRARAALGLVAIGLVLLFSHGLVFVYALLVGMALQAVAAPSRRPGWRDLVPYLALALAAIALFAVGRALDSRYPAPPPAPLVWDAGLGRLPDAFRHALGLNGIVLAAVTVMIVAAPWLLGARPQRARLATAMPLLVAGLLLAAVPHFAMNTAFLYQRFAIFLLPAYAWSFAPPGAHAGRRAAWRPLAVPVMVLLCWTTLGVHAVRAWRFGEESADFHAVLQAAEPGQRALSLVFDPGSAAARHATPYLHFPAWYQARKGGLVDFNFAWFLPQVVRYRYDRAPAVGPGFEWHPETFDWRRHQGDQYRYFFVRRGPNDRDALFRGAGCPPVLRAASGSWRLYESARCAP